jgi:hypothetical protein
MSYDLGVDGDYDGLYHWLDKVGAKECGDSVASFDFKYSSKFEVELKRALKGAFKVTKRTRVYIVRREPKNGESRVKGSWLIGSRRAAPWAGHAYSYDRSDEEG